MERVGNCVNQALFNTIVFTESLEAGCTPIGQVSDHHPPIEQVTIVTNDLCILLCLGRNKPGFAAIPGRHDNSNSKQGVGIFILILNAEIGLLVYRLPSAAWEPPLVREKIM